MKPVLEPSVLSADFAILGEQTELLNSGSGVFTMM